MRKMGLKERYMWFRYHLNKSFRIRWGTLRWTDQHEMTLRYDYDLDQNSVVFDVGGYEGEWADRIYARYRPEIWVFEPITSHYDRLVEKFKPFPRIKVFKMGLAGRSRIARMSQHAERSSEFELSDSSETVTLQDAASFSAEHNISRIDLLKINIEGGEFELLEHIIESGLVESIDNIQVQFHNFIPDAKKKIRVLRKKLRRTHVPTYIYTFNWENWKKK